MEPTGLSVFPTPMHASVLVMVMNDIMAALQELPRNFMSGVEPAWPRVACAEAYDSHRWPLPLTVRDIPLLAAVTSQ